MGMLDTIRARRDEVDAIATRRASVVPLWREAVDALYSTITPPPTELPPNVGEFD